MKEMPGGLCEDLSHFRHYHNNILKTIIYYHLL